MGTFEFFDRHQLTSIDFRESAPEAAFEDMYKNNAKASVEGGLASGVPGDLRGLEYLHKKYGVSEHIYLLETHCIDHYRYYRGER